MDQNNIQTANESKVFLQEHSAMLRIWHWVTFLFLTGSMITVLLVSTMLNPRENIKLVQDQLHEKGVTVTKEQAFAVSHEYEDKMWEVHKYIGIGLAFLLLLRVIIELLQTKNEKLFSRIKNANVLLKQNDSNKKVYRHYIRVKRVYLLFYILLLIMAVTGLGLAFGSELKFSREFHRLIKSIHSFNQYLIYAFVFIHVSGVVIAETSKMKGIVSGMIHGNRSSK